MRAAILFLSLCLSISTCANHAAEKCADEWTPIASQTFPTGTGVNIHFTEAQPGEIKMIADAGFRWVRMDFKWEVIETQRGVYDFAPYERLLAALDDNHIRAYFILDYGNPLYGADRSVRTEEARQAFARWAVASAKHFANRGIVWELFNEPDIDIFWPPKPNVDEYIALALTVGRAWRAQVPNEILIGPASAAIDVPFLESTFKAGLLPYWSAVSIHPYRKTDPETVARDYCGLRKLLQSYKAANANSIPIVSGEWGYSSVSRWMNETQQADMLSRQFLTNAANGIPISIWYDWRDDGLDANEAEHHFGIVRHEFRQNDNSPFEPKPAYFSAKTVNAFLNGSTYQRRLGLSEAENFVLVFSNGAHERIAAWTTSGGARQVSFSLQPGNYTVTKSSGEKIRDVSVGQSGLTIELFPSPIFITPIR
jgi:polysaccharide biosynthesis protein PslG